MRKINRLQEVKGCEEPIACLLQCPGALVLGHMPRVLRPANYPAASQHTSKSKFDGLKAKRRRPS
jgi:hypothetical protein